MDLPIAFEKSRAKLIGNTMGNEWVKNWVLGATVSNSPSTSKDWRGVEVKIPKPS